jgi:hypothetical protein
MSNDFTFGNEMHSEKAGFGLALPSVLKNKMSCECKSKKKCCKKYKKKDRHCKSCPKL